MDQSCGKRAVALHSSDLDFLNLRLYCAAFVGAIFNASGSPWKTSREALAAK
jgi:hypothetical protein